MGTLSSTVFDLFLAYSRDYRIDAINDTSGSATLNTYLEPWLLNSIVEFDSVCDQTLSYTTVSESGDGDGSFSVDLSLKNKIILSRLMLKYWMEKEIQDVLQMQNHITDNDFKTYSSANALRSKQNYLQEIRERNSTMLVEYGYNSNDWESWKSQDFD
jgi:hypothetical protein